MLKDYFGRELEVGMEVVYGKSNRYNPINVGIIKSIKQPTEDSWGEISVLGHGNVKVGTLSGYEINKRVVVLLRECNK